MLRRASLLLLALCSVALQGQAPVAPVIPSSDLSLHIGRPLPDTQGGRGILPGVGGGKAKGCRSGITQEIVHRMQAK